MEIKISTKKILQIVHIVSWVIFIGLCIDAGGFLSNTIYAIINPVIASRFWGKLDFYALYKNNETSFFTITSIMSIVSVLKALLFYLIIKIVLNKRLDITNPFNMEMQRFIIYVSYLTLGIGLFSHWGANHREWILSKGIQIPALELLQIDGASLWIFMSVTLFIIGQIFKRGVELQQENDLTI